MARSSLVAIACLLFACFAAAQSSSNVSPLIDYFSNTNSSTYSYFWTALQAAHLDNYLNDSSLTLTVFAPTNDAWIKRMPTLTRQNNIGVQELFSESKSAALQNMLQYTFLNQLTKTDKFKDGDFLSTLANLCSDAKTLSISVNGSEITLLSAGGSRPKLMDRGILVGDQSQSIVYAIDDVLLPSVVTIPLSVALSNFNASGNNIFSPTIAQKSDTLDTIQTEIASEPPAPIYLAPQTAPSGAPGSVSSSSTSSSTSSSSPSPTTSSPSTTTSSPSSTTSRTPTTTAAATPAATKAPATPSSSGVESTG